LWEDPGERPKVPGGGGEQGWNGGWCRGKKSNSTLKKKGLEPGLVGGLGRGRGEERDNESGHLGRQNWQTSRHDTQESQGTLKVTDRSLGVGEWF